MKTVERRRFLGKIDNFQTKEERNFEQKHLKAYLRGDTYFKAKVLMDVPDEEKPEVMVKRWVKTFVKVKQEFYTEQVK